MKSTRVAQLFGGACLLALCASPAMAQQSKAAPGDAAVSNAPAPAALEELVVTARRTEERLQDVPITVTAMSGDAVEKQNVNTVYDLDRKIPGLQIVGRGLNNAFLRGVPGVIAYWAETPVQLTGSSLFFDMSNIQVLKGPQGTLFGLSADAGAILYEPKRPGHSFGGFGQVTLGDYGERTIEGAVDVPLPGDRVAFRFGVESHHRDGRTYDLTQGKQVNDENWNDLRFAANVRLTDNLENRFIANYLESHNNGSEEFVLYAVNPAGAARAIFGPALDQALALQKQLGWNTMVGSNQKTWQKQFQTNASNITEWTLNDDLTLKNIIGFQSVKNEGTSDIDGVPFPIIDTFVPPSQPSGPLLQGSEEVQLLGKLFDKRLSYTAGVFLLGTHTDHPRVSFSNVFGNLNGTITDSNGRTKAVYGQANFDASDWLHGLQLTAGYRYTWDHRSTFQQNVNGQGVVVASNSVAADFAAGSYTLQATWKVTPRVMFYLNNSKGYSSGGFNLTAPPQFRVYQPESLNNFEGGMKSDWNFGDAVLRLDAAAYYGSYDNVQVQVTQPVQTPTGTTLAVVTQNAAKGEIKGLELETDFIPIRSLEFTFNASVLDGHYTQWMSNGQDLSGTPFLYMPKFKYSVSANYTLPVPDNWGEMVLVGDYSWQGKIKTNIGAELNHPYSTTPSYGTLNARVDLNHVAGKPIDVTFFVNNINNNHWTEGQLGAYNSLGVWGYAVALPRMWGVRLRYTFE
jgi:iron complex outermembrane receptor protein